MSELVVVEQRRAGGASGSLWVREGGTRLPGRDSDARLIALSAGLGRHAGVRALDADAADATVARTLGSLHDERYLAALDRLDSPDPVVLAEFAPPGLEPDIPVSPGLVSAAREGVRTAISAAQRTLAGAEFTYAVCRPPGHHAGPDFHAGYCYLNNAAAAVRTLLDGGLAPVGVLDLDLHYPNGTSALLERMPAGEGVGGGRGVTLHSLHAAPVTNVPDGTELPRLEGERALAFEGVPDPDAYLEEVETSIAALATSAGALVVSLGFDTVRGDPHGGWAFEPELFARVGALLAASGLPVCVVQEGGYALDALADCAHAFATGLLGGADPMEGVEPMEAA
jgi:acetoin utilization deacetylase AcuC-like enzyme